MSSCGNPDTEKDVVMLRRPKFDKSKICVRCKIQTGRVVIRYAVYCKECFFPLIATKFRRSLEPSVNAIPDGQRRKALKASGNLLLAFSGGLGSTVLLDLVNRSYLSTQEATTTGAGKLKGGKDHPRNGTIWPRVAVCYVETCSAFPGVRDRTDGIRTAVAKYERVDLITLRIEDAFDNSWWGKIGGQLTQNDLGIDVTNEELFLSALSNEEDTGSPYSRLRRYISSLPTHTAISSAVQVLTRLLLLHTAMSTGSSHLFFGTSLTSLSISLISSISQGGGFVVREETHEEWSPRIFSQGNGQTGTIRIIRPLRDIGMKECAIWAWWNGLDIVGRERIKGGKQSIGILTKDFIVGLERDYPSTVSTIARTCAKLTPKESFSSTCLLCERPAQYGVQDWKARISIRSLKDPSPHARLTAKDSNLEPTYAPLDSTSASLTSYLCYACHTTLTSRSSRGTTPGSSAIQEKPVPLPVWVTSSLNSYHGDSEGIGLETRHDGEVWNRAKIKGDQMKAVVADFLLDE